MAIKAIKVLVLMLFPGKTIRLWDGSGPYMDANGDLWVGASLGDSLDQIESAMNGEASTLMLSVSGVDPAFTELAYEDMDAGLVIGARVQVLTQPLDTWDQPVGDAEVRLSGTVDNMPSDDSVSGDNIVSSITLEVVNRFNLRAMTNGGVLTDVDQRLRSAILNPAAALLGLFDRFCERIAGLADKAIVWPRFS